MEIQLVKERTVYALGTFSQSWVCCFKEFFPLFGAWFVSTFMPVVFLVITVALGLGLDMGVIGKEGPGWWTLLGLVIPGVLIGCFYAGWIYVALKVARGIPVKPTDIFRPLNQALNSLFAVCIIVSAVSIGLMFFVLPGAMLFLRLQLAPFFIVDQNMGAIEAIKRSWEETRRMFVPLALLDLMFYGLGLVTTSVIFGPFLCNMGLTVATALVYAKWLTDENHPDMPKIEAE
ncbi:MAG: hypothetical protein K8F91_04740 [Candidatus Obscuribacterales bacterium]|nr:hypothetical protein [Candidatus Obscuribacterales bacterium]